MEMVLQFVSKVPLGLPRTIASMSEYNAKPIPKYEWSAVKLWAKDIHRNLIELMEKNEPHTKMKISFVVTNVITEEKLSLKKLFAIFSKPEPPMHLATIICEVDFQQPHKAWENVRFDKIMKIHLAVSTAPKIVQDKILDNQSSYVDLTKDLLEL